MLKNSLDFVTEDRSGISLPRNQLDRTREAGKLFSDKVNLEIKKAPRRFQLDSSSSSERNERAEEATRPVYMLVPGLPSALT